MTTTDIAALRDTAAQAREAQDWERLVNVLQRLAELAPAPAERANALMEAATICQVQLADSAAAEDGFRQVLALDPSHGEALQALEELLVATENWQALTEVLERRAELTDQPAERVELHLRLALIFEDVLGDEQAAREQYERAARLAPSREDVRDGLDRLSRS